jgi:quinol monooxygenase YgiN
MDSGKKQFLKVSGFIPVSKRAEFEKTFRRLFGELPPGCLEQYLSVDIFIANHYHIYSLWQSFEALKAYLHSPQFLSLQITFKRLGLLEKIINGETLEVNCFEVSKME